MRRKRWTSASVQPKPIHCPHCGYDMHVSEMVRHTDGNPICAKCGKVIVEEKKVRRLDRLN